MKAANDYVLIEPVNRNDQLIENIRIKGFRLSKIPQGEPQTGYVRLIGPAIDNPEYKLNDKVIFKQPHPDGFKYAGVNYIPVKHEDIICQIYAE